MEETASKMNFPHQSCRGEKAQQENLFQEQTKPQKEILPGHSDSFSESNSFSLQEEQVFPQKKKKKKKPNLQSHLAELTLEIGKIGIIEE